MVIFFFQDFQKHCHSFTVSYSSWTSILDVPLISPLTRYYCILGFMISYHRRELPHQRTYHGYLFWIYVLFLWGIICIIIISESSLRPKMTQIRSQSEWMHFTRSNHEVRTLSDFQTTVNLHLLLQSNPQNEMLIIVWRYLKMIGHFLSLQRNFLIAYFQKLLLIQLLFSIFLYFDDWHC